MDEVPHRADHVITTNIGSDSLWYWKRLQRWRDGQPLGDLSAMGHEIAFYAKYPAELADELVRGLAGCFEGHAVRAIFSVHRSPLMNSQRWWRVFQSLQPNCPVNVEVFVRFQEAWFDFLWTGRDGVEPNTEQSAAMCDAAEEVEIFGIWLEATGLWEKRPSREESEAKQKRDCVKRLRTLHDVVKKKGQIAPDGIVRKSDHDGRVALKILHLLGLYSGYKKPRKELNTKAKAIIAKYELTAASVTS